MENLEYKINEIAFETAQFLDKTEINKLLGVLASDGVYAMWVWAVDKLEWKYEEDKEKLKEQDLFKFLEKLSSLTDYLKTNKLKMDNLLEELSKCTKDINKLTDEIKNLKKEKQSKEAKQKAQELNEKIKERNEKLNNFFLNLSKDIDELLFFKEILERVLILARYHAKAMGEE